MNAAMRLMLGLTATVAAVPQSGAAEYVYRGRPAVVLPAQSGTEPPTKQPRDELAAVVATPISIASGGAASPFSATGGSGPYSWSSPNLPAGISLSPEGTLQADARASGDWRSLRAVATDASGDSAEVSFDLVVSPRSGALMAWGYNNYGQASPGTRAANPNPAVATGDGGWNIAGGAFDTSCAIKDGNLHCFGRNQEGAAGVGGTSDVLDGPRLVNSGSWASVGTSLGFHTCGIKGTALWCWGKNEEGQVGDGTTVTVTSGPKRIGTWTGWTKVAGGALSTCGLRSGTIYCWGAKMFGGLGYATTNARETAPRAVSGTSWTDVAVGLYHACGIRGGALYCWGENSSGQAGTNGTAHIEDGPREVTSAGRTGWTAVAAGDAHTCGIRSGDVYCWGKNGYGQLGTGGTVDETAGPRRVTTNGGWTGVLAGTQFSCGRRGTELHCWGRNQFGQLGQGDLVQRDVPTRVRGEWGSVSNGRHHVVAVRG